MRNRSPLEQVLLQRVSDHPDATWLKWQESTYTWAEALSNIRPRRERIRGTRSPAWAFVSTPPPLGTEFNVIDPANGRTPRETGYETPRPGTTQWGAVSRGVSLFSADAADCNACRPASHMEGQGGVTPD
jgi:hypothetical protein